MDRLEQEAVSFATEGDGLILHALARQIANLVVETKEATGVGLVITFSPLDGPSLIKCRDFEISDVEIAAPSMRNGIGCVIFVKDGQIKVLEAFTYDEPWPLSITQWSLHYTGNTARNYDTYLKGHGDRA